MAAPHPRMHGITHVPGGPDPIPGLTVPGTTLAEMILAHPFIAGFWKLNETTGDVAYDSGPDGYDLDSTGSYVAPTWGQPPGPPGETSALFGTGVGEHSSTFPALSGDLSVEVWVLRKSTAVNQYLVFQGANPAGGNPGFGVYIENAFSGATNRVALLVGPSTGGFEGDSAIPIDEWIHVAVTRTSGLWEMYVNAVLQAGTYSGGYTSDDEISIGYGAHTSLTGTDALLSYAAVYDGALTAAEIGAHYQGGTAGGVTGVGSSWYHGAGTPTSFLGGDGGYYLNTATGDVWFKADGVWAKIWDEP